MKRFIQKPILKKDQTNKIGLGLNIAILAVFALAMIAVFLDTHATGVYSKCDAHLLRYFGFCFGIAIAFVSIINIVEFALVKAGKRDKLPNWLHVVNLSMAVSSSFNFLFSLLYLIPLVATTGVYEFKYVVTGANLFLNCFIPILVIIQYVFCNKKYSLPNKWQSLIAIIPTLIYFTVYMILAFANMKKGVVNSSYDWYMFGKQHYGFIIVAFIAIIEVVCALSLLWHYCNKVGKINRWAFDFAINLFLAIVILIFTIEMFYINIAIDAPTEGLTGVQTFFLRFCFFTHWSNWLFGLSCIIYCVYSAKMYSGKIKQIPIWAQIIKLASVAMISLTLIMEFVAAPVYMLSDGFDAAYNHCFERHLLFEHFITPVLAIVCFICIEHTNLKWKHLLISATPLAFYALCYIIVLYCNLGRPLAKAPLVNPWDVYRVGDIAGSAGPYIYWLLPIALYILMLIMNWLWWMINGKIHFDLPKRQPVWAELKQDIAAYKKAKAAKARAK